MSLRISDKEKEKLFKQVRTELGAPIVGVELTNEMLTELLEISVDDYVEKIQNFIIEAQWTSLYGLNTQEDDITRALITRNQDYVTQYTYSYSKIVGLGAGEGGYELKSDYIELVAGVQTYQIPANREINEVMWYNPPTLDRSFVDPYLGYFANAMGSNFSTLGNFYVLPSFDILMRNADLSLKDRILNGTLTYKITNGPNGTKFVHLYNTPGGKYDRGGRLLNRGRVWYWYYDISKGNKDDCLKTNKDIIKSPADVPLDDISFEDLNQPSKIWVRQYFVAKSMGALAKVRGKFSGSINVPDTPLTLDYQSLDTEAKDRILTLNDELYKRLERMSPLNMLKRAAEEAEALQNALKYRPMKKPILVM